MTPFDRLGLTLASNQGTAPRDGQEEHLTFVMDAATRAAHGAGKGLGAVRRWVEEEAIGARPLTTLAIAFGLGVFTGWLVKKR